MPDAAERAWLLVRSAYKTGLVAHIPDAAGQPLCHTKLKLPLWRIEHRLLRATVVCNPCKRVQAKRG